MNENDPQPPSLPKAPTGIQGLDLVEHPEQAQAAQIFAAPTLVKELPPPLRRLIGDLTDTERVLISLNLKPGKT